MIVYAHRGDNRHFQENTRAAFDSALQRGFRALELDLRRLGDDSVVVFHDDRLLRLAGLDRSLEELDLTGVREHFPQLLSAYEFIALYGRNERLHLNFEIKDDVRTLDLIEPFLRLCQGTVISSFRHDIVDAALERGFEGAYLVETEQELFDGLPTFRGSRVHVDEALLPLITGQAARFLYHDLYVYTVNDAAVASSLYEHAFFRGFFTDNPELLAFDSEVSLGRAS